MITQWARKLSIHKEPRAGSSSQAEKNSESALSKRSRLRSSSYTSIAQPCGRINPNLSAVLCGRSTNPVGSGQGGEFAEFAQCNRRDAGKAIDAELCDRSRNRGRTNGEHPCI
jgi:hypothetical protein